MPKGSKTKAGLERRKKGFTGTREQGWTMPGSLNMKKAYGTGKDHKKPRR